MRKTFKIICIVATTLLLVTTIASYVIYLKTDIFKRNMIEFIHQHINGALSINGELNWHISPQLKIDFTDATIHNNNYFTHIDAVEINVRLLPLLFKKISCEKLVLHNLKTKYDHTTHANLVNSREIITGVKHKSTKTRRTWPLKIDEIIVRNGNITWPNQQTNQKFTIQQLNLSIKNINIGQPFNCKATFTFQSAMPLISGKFALKSNLTLSQSGIMNVNDLLITSKDLSVTGAGTVNIPTQAINFKLSTIAIHKLNLAIPTITITNTFSRPKINPDIVVIMRKTIKSAVIEQVQKQLKNNPHFLKTLVKRYKI